MAWADVFTRHNKARSVSPGPLSAQPWCRPKGVGRSCARSWCETARSFSDQKVFGCGAELPALAPGARCRVGRSIGSGAPEAVQWTACVPSRKNHAMNVSDPSRMLEQGPDRQRAPRCCSGGVSSINGASESRCSHDGPDSGCQQGLQHFRHWSSLRATGLHEGGFTRADQTEVGFLKPPFSGGKRNLTGPPTLARRRNLSLRVRPRSTRAGAHNGGVIP